MLARGRSANMKAVTPGPGNYSPERCPVPTHRRPPSYSIGYRTRYCSSDQVPAPNKYSLPPVIGPRVPAKISAPAFSMSATCRHGGYSEDLSQTPGPAHYHKTDPNSYMKKGPAYSMLGRARTSKQEITPGPGAHSPEKVSGYKNRAPGFSMGIRHSEYTTPLIIDVSI
uniref:CIMAP1 family member D n=1 Tax=Leptobrachium leishanense TaxID=445787 RepID=A0A8C5LRC1_9ANUR